MRKWGIVISTFYAIVCLGLLLPAGTSLAYEKFEGWSTFTTDIMNTWQDWLFWILAGTLLTSQALLLFLSVDTSQKRLKPRSHVLMSVAVGGALFALLSSAVIWSLGVAIKGEKAWGKLFDEEPNILLFWVILWVFWGVVFCLYFRRSSEAVTRLVSWLLKGSVLELLIVVPCHVIVRRRHDCTAPVATSFGIVTGIAIMLLAFGPSVLFLYKKRLDQYAHNS